MSKFLKAIQNGLNQTWYIISIIIGIMIISLFTVFAYKISGDLISLVIMSLGSILGTIIICRAYFKLSEIQQKKLHEEKIDNSILQEKLNNSENLINQLQLEKERLERMRIDVTSILPMLKIGLISVKVNLYDFMRKVHRNEKVREGLIFKDDVVYNDEYIGVINKKFNAQLGIDLKKLKVKTEGNKIIVSGIKGEFQGYMDEETEWLLRELRQKKNINGKLKHYIINNDDQRIQNSMIEQEKSFKERINLGIEFKNLDNIIQEMAKQFLCVILSTLKKEIVFQEEENDGLTLLDFIQKQNETINDQIKQLVEGS